MELVARKYSKGVEERLASDIVDGEYKVGEENNERLVEDYQDFIDLIDAERGEREYEWMSDIRLPEFASIFLTQSSTDVAAYFVQREFVEVMLEEGDPAAKAAAMAAKKCINKTLNRRELYHYLKYVRAKQISNLLGPVVFKCWWEKEYQTRVTGLQYAFDSENPDTLTGHLQKDDVLVKDCFNYDVIDPRNYFTSEEYAYSLQEKKWVIIRSAKTLQDLEAEQDQAGYFNLDRLGEGVLRSETEAGRAEQDTDNKKQSADTAMPDYYDILERHGKYWAVVEKRNRYTGQPTKIRPGINAQGERLEKAELVECVIIFAVSSGTSQLIAFHPQPYLDANNNPYRPLIRGLCYPHMTNDDGFGDGRHSRELQNAIDDTFNVSNDRTMLATMPVMTVSKHNAEDNTSLYIAPGNFIEVNDNSKDIKELPISDNITGALQQLAMLRMKMQEVNNVYPPQMGNTGAVAASTTATATASADAHSNQRGNFKATTFEYTALTQLYWMILQMTYQFAEPETAIELMSDMAYYFDPTKDFWYKPVSSAIEQEYSKQNKIQNTITMLQAVMPVLNGHPDGPRIVNEFVKRVLTLQGEEFEEINAALFGENTPFQGPGGTPEGGGGPTPVSNQNNVPMSIAEQGARGI